MSASSTISVSTSHYNYTPSFEAAVVVAVLYSIAFALTFIQWVKYCAWVWLVMVLGAASKSLIINLTEPAVTDLCWGYCAYIQMEAVQIPFQTSHLLYY